MAYPKIEQETVLVYESETGEWSAYSTVPKHIRKLSELTDVTVLETEDNGEPKAVRGNLTDKQVRLVKERVLTEEQREELRRRLADNTKNYR